MKVLCPRVVKTRGTFLLKKQKGVFKMPLMTTDYDTIAAQLLQELGISIKN